MNVLEAPTGAQIEVRERRDNYAKFVIEPLERGFGITLGNALRRVLLSSIPGAAVTYVKIDGVLHEFSTIPGVVEDTIDLLLNLKGLPLKLNSDDPKVLTLNVTGPARSHRRRHHARRRRRDPPARLPHRDADEERRRKLSMEIGVEKRRGYVTADRQRNVEHMIGLIPMDSIFSPIRKVNFTVDDTRVGQSVDFDRLTLEIETNGSITPDDALADGGEDPARAARPLHRLLDRREAGSDGAAERVGRPGRDAQPLGPLVQLPQARGDLEGLRAARHDAKTRSSRCATSARSRSTRSNKYSKKGAVAAPA